MDMIRIWWKRIKRTRITRQSKVAIGNPLNMEVLWKITYKGKIFHCHVWLLESNIIFLGKRMMLSFFGSTMIWQRDKRPKNHVDTSGWNSLHIWQTMEFGKKNVFWESRQPLVTAYSTWWRRSFPKKSSWHPWGFRPKLPPNSSQKCRWVGAESQSFWSGIPHSCGTCLSTCGGCRGGGSGGGSAGCGGQLQGATFLKNAGFLMENPVSQKSIKIQNGWFTIEDPNLKWMDDIFRIPPCKRKPPG